MTATVASGQTVTVSSGQNLSDITVASGAGLTISSGGTVDTITVVSGGGLTVSSGGTAGNVTAHGTVSVVGGTLLSVYADNYSIRIDSGGYLSGAVLTSQGSITLDNGQVVGALISGAEATGLAGAAGRSGTFIDTTVYGASDTSGYFNNGYLFLDSGFTASNTLVGFGGLVQLAETDSLAVGVIISSGGVVKVLTSGAFISSAVISQGGSLFLSPGGGYMADQVTVASGAVLTLSSGVTVHATTISSGGDVVVLSGGLASATILAAATSSGSAAAFMDVTSGGTAVGTLINGGTIVFIESGAIDSGTIIGGSTATTQALEVMKGGVSYDVQVLENGFLNAGQTGTAVAVYNPTASGNLATLYIDVHATEYGGVVKDGAHQTLYGAVSGLTISSGGVQSVMGVGTSLYKQTSAVNDLVESGGLVLQNGGFVENAIISSGGVLSQAGGIDSQHGGVATATQIMAGGSAIIGTIGSATVVSSGGTEVVLSGGLESGGTVSGGLLTVNSGGSAVSVTLSADASSTTQLSVQSGGVVSGAIVAASAVAVISGSAISTTVNDNGALRIGSGGIASGTYVSGPTTFVSGTTSGPGTNYSVIVSSGGSANDTTLFHNVMVISAGGSASGITLNDAGIVVQGIAYNLTANSQNGAYRVRIANGGVASGVTTSNLVRTLVYDNGTIYNDIISSGGTEAVVGDGGMAATSYNADILSGGKLSGYYDNVQVISATVETGGLLEIISGAVASDASVGGVNGTMNVYRNGSATGTQLRSGGLLMVGAASFSENAVISSGGTMTLSSGGIGSNTLVESGGQETVSSGSLESGGTVSGGLLTVSSGGSAVSVTLETDVLANSLIVEAGGVVSGAVVAASAIAVISGSAAAITISSGGHVVISSGGVISGTNIVGPTDQSLNDTLLWVSAGGAAYNTTLFHEGMIVDSGAYASGVTLNDGSLTVYGRLDNLTLTSRSIYGAYVNGGTVSGVTTTSGVIQVYNSGQLYNDSIGSDGKEFVIGDNGGATSYNADIKGTLYAYLSDARVISATVEARGSLQVTQTAQASSTIVSGTMAVSTSGSATGTQVRSGGQLTVGSASTAENTVVSSGGTMVVSSGSAFATTLYDRASAVVSAGGIISGTNVSGPADSQLQNTVLTVGSGGSAYNTTVFHDKITVGSGAYASDVTLNQAGMTINGTVDGLTINPSGNNYYAVLVVGGTVSGISTLSAGGIAVYGNGSIYDDTVGSNSVELLLSNGGGATSYNTDILSGGLLSAYNDDVTVMSAKVEAGGLLQVTQDAVASGTVVSGTMHVDSNGSATSTVVLSGGLLTVGDPSLSENAIVSSGGVMILSSGGTGSNTLVETGGQETISSGSLESGGTVSGGLLTVSSGGSAVSVTLATGTAAPALRVESGGVVSGTVVQQSASAVISGSAIATTIYDGGQIIVSSGGVARDTTVIGPDSSESVSNGFWVYGGGAAYNTTVTHGTIVIDSGAQASGVTLNDAGMTVKGTLENLTVNYQNPAILPYGVFIDGGTVSGVVGSQSHIEVYNNGSIYNDTIASGSVEYVLSSTGGGGASYAADILSGGRLSAFNADASVISATVETGGRLQINDHAVASGTTLIGTMNVSGTGSASDTQILSGGLLTILASSFSENTIISSGGRMALSSGGVGSGTEVSSGGRETVSSGGLESGGTVSDGTLTISAGGSAVSVSVEASTPTLSLFVQNGGFTSGVTVKGSATVTIAGSAVATTIQDSALVTVSSDGVVSGTILSGPSDAGAGRNLMLVSSGGAAYDTTVFNDGMVVNADATASGVTLNDASIIVKGTVDNLTVNSQGSTNGVYDHGAYINGGTASGVVLSQSHIEVYNSGSIHSTTIGSDGTAHLLSSTGGGATSYDATILSGGLLSAQDADVSVLSATVESGGQLQVTENAVASGATVRGLMSIDSTGSATDTQLLSGGLLTVGSSSLSENTTVLSGGVMTLSSGGSGSNTLVEAGGQETVSAGGLESGGTISGALLLSGAGALGRQISLLDGGTLEATDSAAVSGLNTVNGAITVENGAEIDSITARSGAITLTGAAILSGGSLSDNATLTLTSGAIAQNLTLTDGTLISVTDQAVLSATRLSSNTVTTIVSTGSGYDLTVSGGQLLVSGGGVLSAATVTDNGDIHIYGGQVSSVTLSGGTMEIDDDGYARQTEILSGGLLAVGDPSISENAVVSSGGVMTVSSGGIGSNTVVESGGQETVFSGSLESGGTVSGGLLTISSGGSAIHVTLASDASSPSTLVVADGGIASATLIEDHSIAFISGSTVSDTISGATAQEIVSSGGSVSDATIAGGGTLTVLDNAQADTIAVENGTLSLSGAHASVRSVTLDTAGQITLSDGAVLSGSSYDAGAITAQSGGTFESAILTGTAQTSATSGGTVSAVTLQSGTRLTVSSGGTGQGTILESGAILLGVAGATVDDTTISSGALFQIDSAATSSDTYLTSGGSIELLNTSWSDTDTVSFADNILTIDDDGRIITINLSAADDVYLTRDFVLSRADTDPLYANSNDILITLAPVACFCRGTRIDTEFGPMLIENILEGTGILTLDGRMVTLRWKAVRRYSRRQMVLGAALRPLVIRADALGHGLPCRDLRVSQLHMLYIDELLVPAAALVNDRTIFIEQSGSAMEYYHLDIGVQNIIFAEGVATESLTDDDASRRGFDNYDQHVGSLPSSADVIMAAPLIREGEIIATLQARYAQRAAMLGAPFRQICENGLFLL
ncbi:Hint domain-containing protein [Acetobacter sp.]|jgi:autotransporter passenger strand-loop-strand repeat protein|uniref:Hint domain-containing protein n=1 Tax=Acetobacter sp. TaxID=440 RepID=UPI0025C602D8|nr:Hint domain-containing protein [Acetobacter sp.]MCH4092183.1 Hint domain-containing protein [Acetobacter sp.]MCI1299900.1 Hint domain-containing protein [Acetobacter sp.]MCI1315918.1 Hint domain-containing protein [Acetobacter sp.]